MWPRRKKSDLVVRPGGQYGMGVVGQRRGRQEASHPRSPGHPVPIRILRSPPPTPAQDPMWPRRKKSDLMIYQATRIPKEYPGIPPGIPRNTLRDIQEYPPGIPRNTQEYSGIPRNTLQEYPGISRNTQEYPGILAVLNRALW